MPLPTDEKIVALSNADTAEIRGPVRSAPRLSTGSRQGHHVEWNLYAHTGSGFAQQGAPLEPAIHAGHGAVLQLHRHSGHTGQ